MNPNPIMLALSFFQIMTFTKNRTINIMIPIKTVVAIFKAKIFHTSGM